MDFNKKTILFHGELPPKTIHGISISNKLNLEQLSKKYNTLIVEEVWVTKSIYKKILHLFRRFYLIAKSSALHKPSAFYLIYSISFFGSLKTLLLILICKIFSPSTKIIIHLHRGDLIKHLTFFINRYFFRIINYFTFSYILLSTIQSNELSGFSKKTKYILHNTIDFDRFQYTYEVFRKTSGNLKFLYLSNYLVEKGIFELINGFSKFHKKHQNSCLIMHGASPNEQIEKDLKMFKSSYIQINKTISEKNKKDLLKTVDCLILPSYTEGQPLIILEAMAFGIPVIVTNVGYISEMVGFNYPFLMPDHLPSTIELYLKKFFLLSNDEKNNLGKHLRSRYLDTFSQETHKKNLLFIFNSILTK